MIDDVMVMRLEGSRGQPGGQLLHKMFPSWAIGRLDEARSDISLERFFHNVWNREVACSSEHFRFIGATQEEQAGTKWPKIKIEYMR